MSKKEQSDANGGKSLLRANLFQDVSSVPKSSYAKQIVQNNRKAKFLKEYWDAGKGKRIVKLKYPSKHGNGRNGKVLVVWQFDPKGELMRNQAVQRHAREQLRSEERRVGKEWRTRWWRES